MGLPSSLVFDSSTVLCWVLQEQRWQAVQKFIDEPKINITLPAPGLTEVIFRARAKGNTSSVATLAAAISSNGIAVTPNDQVDYVRAAELLEISEANPGSPSPRTGKRSTLSLGDSLILAFAERTASSVLSRDRYWGELKAMRLLDINIQTF